MTAITLSAAVAELFNQKIHHASRLYSLDEWTAAVVRHHQEQRPGFWQNNGPARQQREMTRICTRAIRAGEFAPARVIDLYA